MEEVQLYKNADVFVLPSFYEGQSLALTQAMSMGLCPVVADNCGQKDFIKHQQNGLLFKTGNDNDFIQQLHWLLNHKQQMYSMGQQAKVFVQSYTWQAATDEIITIMNLIQ